MVKNGVDQSTMNSDPVSLTWKCSIFFEYFQKQMNKYKFFFGDMQNYSF